MWIVRRLLEKGHSARATQRSAALEYFYKDKLDISVVADLAKEGAFDETVKDVDAIAHAAAPIHWNNLTPQEVINTAVEGTLGILKSAQKYGLIGHECIRQERDGYTGCTRRDDDGLRERGKSNVRPLLLEVEIGANIKGTVLSNVKRIVITLSKGAVNQNSDPNETFYTEGNWNDEAVREVKEKGEKVDHDDLCYASKALAERGRVCLEFLWRKEEHVVLGTNGFEHSMAFSKPPILDASAPSGTMKFWWNAIVTTTSDSLDDRSFITHNTPWVDVRDVADSHYRVS
ncbi:hypothetical protein BKA70DRAFT_1233954 [Coprinopsis sp. MPI-PUGE-AT-0042]|nr:hypothetical protein BKA70DRAFT_1233954 [Coprinopsis sp. MPI-PUGE-AT-0042]